MSTSDAQMSDGRSQATSSGLSRRRVLKTAAWTAPAVAVVVGIPEAAHASPGDSVLGGTWNNDSFRADSNSNMTSGTPTATGGLALVTAINLAVTGKPLTDLKVTMQPA